ncbi:MAG: 1-acyl-sn-glycerol-3-phosphate acyltransferase, partial [Oscillospiraceae bacterium]|nr:1-acyl-sn-glycerol-3-phosphate acyltransferase [Oscillospiraceae bacterium]
AAICCANHSSAIDPIVVSFAFRAKRVIHFIAKSELFKLPILGGILRAIGVISVDRKTADTGAVKASLKYLKSGECIGIFPEGTRSGEAGNSEARLGAVKLAAKTGAPIVPIYIPRKKSVFRRIRTVIGEPYFIDLEGKRATDEDYRSFSDELMDRIERLKDTEDS